LASCLDGTRLGNLPQSVRSRVITGRLVALVLLGIVWRTARYLLQFPIWGDEAHICLNLIERDYVELTQPLRFAQAAPVLFLWTGRAVCQYLGSSELALRLVSLLAGVAALLLFWRLGRSVLPPLAGAVAVGILAVSYYPVRHACEVKSFGLDLFVATALLSLAVVWLRQPGRLLWPVLLTLFLPLALGASYPSVFIAGTISLVQLPAICRTKDWRMRVGYAVYNLAMLASFWTYYCLIGVGQYESEGGHDNIFYSDWFPPAEPGAWFGWLISVHTGTMFAYPAGGHSGGSTLTFMLCLLGTWHWARGRHWSLLVLCLAPFVLTFVAAVLHRYPYGGSARYEQHLAPAICLLAGSGIAVIIGWFARTELARRRAVAAVLVLLAVIGVAGLGRDLFKPYKTAGDHRAREVVQDIIEEAGPDDRIVVMEPVEAMPAPVEWYLRRQGERVAWDGRIDWEHLRRKTHRLWTLYFLPDTSPLTGGPPRLEAVAKELRRRSGRQVVLVQHDDFWLRLGWQWDPHTHRHCDFYQWRFAPRDPTSALP
jgi:hypothetical protein